MTEHPTTDQYPQGHHAGRPVTGHPDVDAAIAAVAAAADAPPAEQVGPLSEAHRVLRETLDTIGDV